MGTRSPEVERDVNVFCGTCYATLRGRRLPAINFACLTPGGSQTGPGPGRRPHISLYLLVHSTRYYVLVLSVAFHVKFGNGGAVAD